MTVSFPLDLMGQMLGEFSRGLSVTVWLASRGIDSFCQDYLFKNVQIALEDRDSASLWSRGQIYFLSSIVKMCLSRAKIIQVFLQLLKKDGFPKLNPVCSQHPPGLLCTAPVSWEGKGD